MIVLDVPTLGLEALPWLLVPIAVVLLVARITGSSRESVLAWAYVRCAAQLSLAGLVLVPVFQWDDPRGVLGLLTVISVLGAWLAARSLRRFAVGGLLPAAACALVPTVAVLVLFATGVVLKPRSWLPASVAIPLAGMVAGNAVTAIGLAGERFLDSLRSHRGEVEARLVDGLTGPLAVRPLVAKALWAGMLPGVHGLMAAGVVSLPGMMTGQLLAGASPWTAVRFQLLVMSLWTCAGAVAPALFLHWVSRSLLSAHRLPGEARGGGAHFRPGPSGGENLAPPAVFLERPPEALTQGFAGDPLEP